MINSVDAQSAQFLSDLQRIQDRQSRVQRQIGSGLRVNKPSDDPDAVMNILQLRSEVERASAIASRSPAGTRDREGRAALWA